MDALLDAIAHLEMPEGACRIFHGRGGRFPGCEAWTLDAFPPVLLLTSFRPLQDAELAAVGCALQRRWDRGDMPHALNWVLQVRHEGAAESRLMQGSIPTPHTVNEAGSRYHVQLLKGQNHGLFLDMAEGRHWVAQLARQHPGLKVLNLFAYTCAFSVVALQHGAAQVVNVDMSRGALATGQRNHQTNGLASGASFWAHDIFSSWGKIGRSGPYDLVIADPPSYQKGSFVASKDYARLIRRLPDLLVPGGQALLCLNAPELGPTFLQAQVAELAPTLRCVQRLDNPPAFADVDEARSLKALVFRQDGHGVLGASAQGDAAAGPPTPAGLAASAAAR